MLRDDAALLDIANAARMILQFAEGRDKDAFLQDAKTQAAVLHKIVILGEAAKRLSQEFIDRHPDIPWREIRGMRDRVIHQYDRVDLHLVWELIDGDLPELLGKIEPLLPRRSG